MVATCAAYGCSEMKCKDSTVSFHRFPHENTERLNKWIQAIRRILKATEVIFKRRVINTERGITVDRMIDLKIESAVVQQIGNRVFNNVDGHYFEHEIGQEMDHLSSLLRTVVQRYIKLRLKTYGKMYTM